MLYEKFNLQCLILDNMIWRITPKSLRDIGELTHLKKLRITSCFRIHTFHPEIDIHTFKCNFKTLEVFLIFQYITNQITAQFMCLFLLRKAHFSRDIFFFFFQILDLQNTAVEIRLFEWLCQIKTLKHLYLQCPTYLKKEWSDELLEDFKKLYYKQKFVPLKMFDKLLYDFHSKVEVCPPSLSLFLFSQTYTHACARNIQYYHKNEQFLVTQYMIIIKKIKLF